MAGHGYPWTKLGFTMDASESQCLCGAFELTAWLLSWAGLIMPVANKLSAPGLSIYCGNTHFSPAKWWKQNTTNEATIVLHIKRDASVAYLCVRHTQFGILRKKPYCMCQKLMSNGNIVKTTIVYLNKIICHRIGCHRMRIASACNMANRHNAHNVTSGFLLN